MLRIVCTLVLGLFAFASAGFGQAAEATRAQIKGLDEQVQEIKSDVLSIAAELSSLEEKLLYPSNTQFAVFVAIDEGEKFRLDAVQIEVNGRPVAHHIYSFKELDALQRGGVQRIYTGNVTTGSHELLVSVIGKLNNGQDYSRSERFSFDKGIDPHFVGITLASPDSGKTGIRLEDW
ncbi:MAG: hypothetical protein ACNA7W_09270 [Pseudomonadales bacterium]